MAELVTIKNSKKQYKLNINPADYDNDPAKSSLIVFSKEQRYVDYTEPVQIDSGRLMHCFNALRSKDFKYYHYILSKLVRNDQAIQISHNEVCLHFRDKSVQIVAESIERLVKQGLLFRPPKTRGFYIVNPVYAWKGNRLDYLDVSVFKDHSW